MRNIYYIEHINNRFIISSVFVFIYFLNIAVAQDARSDTIHKTPIKTNNELADTAKRDTTNNALYNAIIKNKPKSRVAKQIYSFIFRNPVDTTKDQINPDVTIASLFEAYRGKTIRNISIISLPPFGYSVNNPDYKSEKRHFGNKLHYDTKEYVIESNLLFKSGQTIDPTIMEETEVLIRDLRYVRDVRIYIDTINSTEADIKVVTQDVWSIGFYISNISTNAADIKVYDRNFLGFGNEFSIRAVYDKDFDDNFGFGAKYLYRNIRKTFINTELEFFNDIATSDFRFKVNRVLNPKINIFGEAEIDIKESHKTVNKWDSISATQHYNYSASIGWASKIFPSGRRFAVSARYLYQNPSYENIKKPDKLEFANIRSRYILGQFSLFKQDFHREHLMRSYSNTENMAYGYNVTSQLGYNIWPGLISGFYASIKASGSKKHRFGSFFTEGTMSSHYNGGFYQGLVQFRLRFTSPLVTYLAQNKARGIFSITYSRFLNPHEGFNSYFYYSDYTTMGLGYQNKLASKGKEAFVINWEQNFFTKFNVLEFRYLVYTFLDMAWMKNHKPLFNSNNLFTGVGIGIRIRNELLVFKTMDIKFGWYPNFSRKSWNYSSSDPPISPSFIPTNPSIIIK